MAAPIQYTVKTGDTLNKIASANGFSDYKSAGANISGYDAANPDAIRPGQVLTIGGAGGPTTKEVPGIGTLTITPKSIPTAGPKAPEDLTGAYARAGLTPPATPGPAGTANGYVAPAVAGLPGYPSGVDTAGSVASITKSYNDTLASITALETKLASAAAASPEEQQLSQQLATKKEQLKSFDLGTLQGSEDLNGQGRGITTSNVNLQDQKMQRTRALERLGLAQEADTLTTQLGLAQDARKAQGDIATTEYNLATKKLDIALGVADKIHAMNQTEQNNARQYLLDTVNFADGKAYSQLDAETQAAITHAVANSPITLDMVKTALQSGADKAKAAKAGDLRSVPGVGVVQIDPATGHYKVVVPENPTPAPTPTAPTFEKYLADQKIPFPALTQQKVAAVRAEYDAKYGNVNVNLGKLTPTNKATLSQAGLTSAPSAVQSYFLNSPPAFQDQYQRDIASGKIKGSATLDVVVKNYTDWYNAQKKTGTDWASILNAATAK